LDFNELDDFVILLIIKIEIVNPKIKRKRWRNIVNPEEVAEYIINARKNIIPKMLAVSSILSILINKNRRDI